MMQYAGTEKMAACALVEAPCFRGFLDLDSRRGVEGCGLHFECATEYSSSNLCILQKTERVSGSSAHRVHRAGSAC
jgi:hypothetical protein